MNDSGRSEWIDNDEGLYNYWKSSRLSKKEFIKKHRAEIDDVIELIDTGKKRAHFLEYDRKRR